MKGFYVLILCAISMLCGCSSRTVTNAGTTDVVNNPDSILVVYYSQTGATKAVAEELQRRLHCDIVNIEAVNPYAEDYDATIQRWRKEVEDSVKVEIMPLSVNLDDYDTIFLGFPIWGGTYALPVATFLADNSLEGKTVVTFATFGSGGIDSATGDVAAAQPNAKVIKGYGVRNARIEKAPAEIERFLIESGYIAGKVDQLPDYVSSEKISDDDIKVFNEACGNYKYPLGTPTGVATRMSPDGKDYKFDVKSQTPDGKEHSSTIYVTVPTDGKPEFKEVVRHSR